MIRVIISKMATKINSMMKKMVTKATRPIMNMLILMIQDQIDGVCFGYAIYGAAFFDFATAYYYLWCWWECDMWHVLVFINDADAICDFGTVELRR